MANYKIISTKLNTMDNLNQLNGVEIQLQQRRLQMVLHTSIHKTFISGV